MLHNCSNKDYELLKEGLRYVGQSINSRTSTIYWGIQPIVSEVPIYPGCSDMPDRGHSSHSR